MCGFFTLKGEAFPPDLGNQGFQTQLVSGTFHPCIYE